VVGVVARHGEKKALVGVPSRELGFFVEDCLRLNINGGAGSFRVLLILKYL
jgi:hypothetical protein